MAQGARYHLLRDLGAPKMHRRPVGTGKQSRSSSTSFCLSILNQSPSSHVCTSACPSSGHEGSRKKGLDSVFKWDISCLPGGLLTLASHSREHHSCGSFTRLHRLRCCQIETSRSFPSRSSSVYSVILNSLERSNKKAGFCFYF